MHVLRCVLRRMTDTWHWTPHYTIHTPNLPPSPPTTLVPYHTHSPPSPEDPSHSPLTPHTHPLTLLTHPRTPLTPYHTHLWMCPVALYIATLPLPSLLMPSRLSAVYMFFSENTHCSKSKWREFQATNLECGLGGSMSGFSLVVLSTPQYPYAHVLLGWWYQVTKPFNETLVVDIWAHHSSPHQSSVQPPPDLQ